MEETKQLMISAKHQNIRECLIKNSLEVESKPPKNIRFFNASSSYSRPNASVEGISNMTAENINCNAKKMHFNRVLNNTKMNIFVNPNKLHNLKRVEEVRSTQAQTGSQAAFTNVTSIAGKVYINPNFHTSLTQTSRQYNEQAELKGATKDKIKLNRNDSKKNVAKDYHSKDNNDCSDQLHQISCIVSLNDKKKRTTQCKQNPSLYSNNITIYINPDFNLSKKHDSSSTDTLSNINKKGGDTNLTKLSNLKNNKQCPATSVNSYSIKKDTLYDSVKSNSQTSTTTSIKTYPSSKVHSEPSKISETLFKGTRKRKSIENVDAVKKKMIFLNPNFKSKVCGSNVDLCKKMPITMNSVKLVPGMNYRVKTEINDTTNIESRTQKILFPSPKLQRTPMIGRFSKIVDCSSKSDGSRLVSLSATKLVRKRKCSLSSKELNKSVSNNNLGYVSKTKLIRRITRKCITNSVSEKLKSKNTVKKNIECILPYKPDSRMNVASTSKSPTPTNATITTKIKSKNGKTLKLVHKKMDLLNNFQESGKVKCINVVQKRKLSTSKQGLCTVHARSSKTKFSKVNVPIKKNTSTANLNKYVYKSKDYTPRKTLTKAAVLNRRRRYNLNKNSLGNSSTEKAKVIKSKYNNIPDNNNKFSMKLKNSKYYNEVLSSSKRRWKKTPLKNKFKRKQFCIVNIDGAFYRCSRTSLTRNKPSKKVTVKQSKCNLLYIHGKKFVLENNGQTLTCLDNSVGRGRIDIGGVTFIRSPSGTSLTRTNYHTARSILIQAKQKSISLLKRNLKKNNEPCIFFHRFGRCSGKERGTCIRQHDPKYVVVCKNFVQDQCSDPKCLLSHAISVHNMPTCQHFLAGNCGRDNCPYPHIKVSDNAPLCLQFLQGYCPIGDQCVKRHILICPAFEKGACPRGKYCPYPHPNSKQGNTCTTKFKTIKKKLKPTKEPKPVSTPSLRYFEDVNLQQEIQIEVKKEDCGKTDEKRTSDDSEEISKPIFTRPKLGRLPSFIPLSTDETL